MIHFSPIWTRSRHYELIFLLIWSSRVTCRSMPSPRKRPGLCPATRFHLQSRVCSPGLPQKAPLSSSESSSIMDILIFLKQNIKHLVNQSNYYFPRNTRKSTLFPESREKHKKYPISLFGKKTFHKGQGDLLTTIYKSLFMSFFHFEKLFFSMPRRTLETQQKNQTKSFPSWNSELNYRPE